MSAVVKDPDALLTALWHSLFFVGYIVFQGVNNIIMKKVGPRIWLTVLTASFAAITM
jgi:hypothetical protein